MKNLICIFLLAGLAVTVTAGCESQSALTEPPATSPFEITSAFSLGRPPEVAGAWNQASDEEKVAQLEASMHATMTFRKVVDDAQSWSAADKKVQALLENPVSAAPRYEREQIAAHQMLTKRLLQSELTPEKQEAIAHYTGFLIENHSPEAKLVSNSLQSLKTYWEPERIAEAAEQAALAAQARVGKKANCEACSRDELEKKFSFLEESEHRNRLQNLSAIDKLQTMASHSSQ